MPLLAVAMLPVIHQAYGLRHGRAFLLTSDLSAACSHGPWTGMQVYTC